MLETACLPTSHNITQKFSCIKHSTTQYQPVSSLNVTFRFPTCVKNLKFMIPNNSKGR